MKMWPRKVTLTQFRGHVETKEWSLYLCRHCYTCMYRCLCVCACCAYIFSSNVRRCWLPNAFWLIFLQHWRPTSPVHHSGVRQEVEHKGNIWKKWEYFSFSGPNAKSSRYTIDILAECSSMCRLLHSLWFVSQENSLLAHLCQVVV